MKVELYAGMCEQYRYTIVGKNKAEIYRKIRGILYFPRKVKRQRFMKLPTRPGNPRGAVHYRVAGHPGSILVIYRDE